VTTKLKASLLLVGVFLLGAVAGGGVSFAYTQREAAEMLGTGSPDFRARRFFHALSRELDLTGEQEAAIREIMEAQGPKRDELSRELFERCGKPLREQRERAESQIRAVLTPEQQARFDEITEKHHRRFLFDRHRRHGRPPSGRPAP
jgi:Spy/CpxP family protein refolding chaperone